MFSQIRKIVFSTLVLFFSALIQVSAQTNGVGNSGSGSNGVGNSGIGSNGVGTSGGAGFTNPLISGTITEFLLKIIDILLVFALPITVLFIMYGGFMLVTAQGESKKLEDGRNAILWAVVGGVIALGAKVIIDVIQKTVNTL